MEAQQPEAQVHQQAVSKGKMTTFFGRLRARGLTAEMDFSCCSACGMYEVDDVRSPTDTGYVFYNFQSALKIQEMGEVMLSYGDYPEIGAVTAQQVGKIVADEAERMGITIEWNGSANTRIKLVNLDKASFQKHFEIILEYPPEAFGGEHAAVVRTEDGHSFPCSFTDKEVKHTCGNGRFPCAQCRTCLGPCRRL